MPAESIDMMSTLPSIEMPASRSFGFFDTSEDCTTFASDTETAPSLHDENETTLRGRSAASSEGEMALGECNSPQQHRSLHHAESYKTHMHYVPTSPPSDNQPGKYRYEELQDALDNAATAMTIDARVDANQKIMEKLASLGVNVFLISYQCEDIWMEVKHCIAEASAMAIFNCSTDRCLFYQDEKGRVFNLVVAGDFSGLAKSYDSMLDKASGVQAMSALVVLVRTFACAGE